MADIKKNTTDLVTSAQSVVVNLFQKANSSNISTSIKDGLLNSANSIQSLLDNVLLNNGLITDKQVNELDAQLEIAKLKLLDSKSNNTVMNLAMYVGLGVVIVALLWYFTSEKK